MMMSKSEREKSLSKIFKWLKKEGYHPQQIRLSYPDNVINAIRIDTDYQGPYSGPEQFRILNAVRSHIRRYHKELNIEQRGYYTAIFIH